jgi:RHS repeat-associated protein
LGNLAAEYGPGETGGTQYVSVDHLGSTRLVTDASGQPEERHDYLPFGEELFAGVGGRTEAMKYPAADTGVRLKFTGKERDAETGLDYFGARYFSGAQGRFTTPDWSERPQPVPYANLNNPQSLNLYAYVRNNPLTNRDPNGHWCVLGIGTTCDKNIPPPPKPPPPPAPANPSFRVYPKPDQAAVAAARMNQQAQKQTGFEHASSVYTLGPGFTYTNAVTQRKRGRVAPKTRPGTSAPSPPICERHRFPEERSLWVRRIRTQRCRVSAARISKEATT